MSVGLYNIGGLRFWNEDEIQLRELFQRRMIRVITNQLKLMNAAWTFHRMEGPILTPKSSMSPAYSEDDIFVTNHVAANEAWCLRAETTASSYAYARSLLHITKLPICVYQAGKSFRRELSDGATAAKLRFNEFWQLEFQCIYSDTTKADYRAHLIEVVMKEIARFTCCEVRKITSDRLPAYSESTVDIEAKFNDDWRELVSCSIRKDFSPETRVCEIAIGLDRIAVLAASV
jgi:glycyl-tRNA synthetase